MAIAPQDGPEPDTVAAFVQDLRTLWTDAGSPTFSSLARKSGLSRTSLNDAVTRTDKIASERVLRGLVGVLDPPSIGVWLVRRSLLVQPKSLTDQPSVPATRATVELESKPASRSLPWGWKVECAIWAVFICAISLAWAAVPYQLGGLDMVKYCHSVVGLNPPRTQADQFNVTQGWDGWRCRRSDGSGMSIDPLKACRDQYPSFWKGGTYTFVVVADPAPTGLECWRSWIRI